MNQPIIIKPDKRFKKGNIAVKGRVVRGRPESVKIAPVKLGRHYIWSNLYIPEKEFERDKSPRELSGTSKRDKMLRNAVDSKIGLHIFNCQDNLKQLELTAPTSNKE